MYLSVLLSCNTSFFLFSFLILMDLVLLFFLFISDKEENVPTTPWDVK